MNATSANEHLEIAALLGATSGNAETLARLHHTLEGAARRDGLLDIAYRTLDSPVGTLLLAATEHGLVRIAYEREGHDAVLEDLAAALSPRILFAPNRLDAAAAELDQYFSGQRTVFDLPLDFSLTHGMTQDVQRYLPRIGYGATVSYAEVAQGIGRPRAVRAVGTACGANALPIVLPCHRVIRADGSLGGYVGGPDAKRTLLNLEAA